MSEKRFKLSKYVTPSSVSYFCDENGRMLNKEVVNKLNEQQATINHLEKVNGKNFAKRRLLEQDNLVLRDENEQLRKELKEIKENPINYF